MRPICQQVNNCIEIFLQDEHILTVDKTFKKSELTTWDVASKEDFLERFKPLEERQALVLSLYKLSRRPMHTQELEPYLAERFFSPHAINHAIEECCRLGALNDSDYEAQFVRRLQTKGKSRREILFKAKNRGITTNLTDHFSSEEETLKALIQKRYPILLEPQADFLQKQKAMNALARRGFSYSSITSALKPMRYK